MASPFVVARFLPPKTDEILDFIDSAQRTWPLFLSGINNGS